MTGLAEEGARLMGAELARAEPLPGGDLSRILWVTLTDGRRVIVKGGPSPRTEAAMLGALAEAGVPVPEILAAGDRALVLAIMPTGGRIEAAWASLGEIVARLHAAEGEGYGWAEDYAFGAVAIENGPTESWPRFWAERRLLVHLPHVAPPLARRVEALAADLANRLPARPRSALLHGDLWGGNVLVARDMVSSLIDPACYRGHAEVDLAMLELFGRPGADFYAAYGALEPGREARLPIYLLWPALVHLRLFGGSYRPMVERLLGAAGV